MTVQRELGFKAQRIARTQANRLHAFFLARVENGVPHMLAHRERHKQFKTIFARITRTRNDAACALHVDDARVMIFQFREIGRFDFLQDLFRKRTLKREHVKFFAHILQRDIKAGRLRFQPRVVLVAIARVDDDHPFVRKAIDKRVVHACAVGVTHDRVFRRIDFHIGKIRGEQVLQIGQGIGTRDANLTHMVNVKQSRSAAHCAMFVENAFVLHRHLPTAELDHFRAERAVRFVQWGTFQFHKCESCEKFARRICAGRKS